MMKKEILQREPAHRSDQMAGYAIFGMRRSLLTHPDFDGHISQSLKITLYGIETLLAFTRPSESQPTRHGSPGDDSLDSSSRRARIHDYLLEELHQLEMGHAIQSDIREITQDRLLEPTYSVN